MTAAIIQLLGGPQILIAEITALAAVTAARLRSARRRTGGRR